ncbi:MAG: radical SAM enzyme, Cfr family protein [Planctomycetota bacterium]
MNASTITNEYTRHESREDASVNWDKKTDVGRIEARYVRRTNNYVVVYLSSQTGCNQACRMCHLTATGQTEFRDVTQEEFLTQADQVLSYYRTDTRPAQSVHFNFMARGEPLSNPILRRNGDQILGQLAKRAMDLKLRPRYLVSTILPMELGDRRLEDIFVTYHPEIYYSIYSVDESFRRRWLPKALPVTQALDRLADWQRHTYKICKIHYAFIRGENDSESDVHAICDELESRKLMVHVNIVRYNPADPRRHGSEPSEAIIERNAQIYRKRLPDARVKVIPRVGRDVNASCGMFIK